MELKHDSGCFYRKYIITDRICCSNHFQMLLLHKVKGNISCIHHRQILLKLDQHGG